MRQSNKVTRVLAAQPDARENEDWRHVMVWSGAPRGVLLCGCVVPCAGVVVCAVVVWCEVPCGAKFALNVIAKLALQFFDPKKGSFSAAGCVKFDPRG